MENIKPIQKINATKSEVFEKVNKIDKPLGYQMKLKESSVGKDTMTGHWEVMGLYITTPFKTFTDTGFPQELLDELSAKTGHGIVGNKSAMQTLNLAKETFVFIAVFYRTGITFVFQLSHNLYQF